MKAKDLIPYLERHLEDDLVILVSKPSIGPRSTTPVEGASVGFDWDKGTILLNPSVPLVPKTDEEKIFDMARDLIMYLATKPVKRESYEIGIARRIAEKIHGDYMKYQKFFHRE